MALTGMAKLDHSTICQFLHRGLSKVQGDWSMVCTTHNLLKLYAVRNREAPEALAVLSAGLT